MDPREKLSPERVESIFRYMTDNTGIEMSDPSPEEPPSSRSEKTRGTVADAWLDSAADRASATLEVVRREWALALTRAGNISGDRVRRPQVRPIAWRRSVPRLELAWYALTMAVAVAVGILIPHVV
jgi:uncharacterized membrane protein YccC